MLIGKAENTVLTNYRPKIFMNHCGNKTHCFLRSSPPCFIPQNPICSLCFKAQRKRQQSPPAARGPNPARTSSKMAAAAAPRTAPGRPRLSLPPCAESGRRSRERRNMAAAGSGGSRADNGYGGQQPRRKKGPGALATAYLVIYNVVMTAG